MSLRIDKVSELLRQEISSLIFKELDFSREVIITVTRIKTFSDLSRVIVWVSVIPFSKAEEVLKILDYHKFNIQKLLDKKLKMKIVPKIKFKLDISGEKASKVEKLLKNA